MEEAIQKQRIKLSDYLTTNSSNEINQRPQSIIQRSIENVRKRAAQQKASPQRLTSITSVVASNIQSRIKANKNSIQQRLAEQAYSSVIQNVQQYLTSDLEVPIQALRNDSPGAERIKKRINQILSHKQQIQDFCTTVQNRRSNEIKTYSPIGTPTKLNSDKLANTPSCRTERQAKSPHEAKITQRCADGIFISNCNFFENQQKKVKQQASTPNNKSPARIFPKSPKKNIPYVSPYSYKLKSGKKSKKVKQISVAESLETTSPTDFSNQPLSVKSKAEPPVSERPSTPLNKFHNADLEAYTSKVQEEFNNLLNAGPITKLDNFYQLMNDFYDSSRRHQSPNSRLIALKHSTILHKKVVVQNSHRTQDYGIHYTSSPGISYLVEPVNGELNYDQARRNPVKFYDEILNSEVLHHELKDVNGKVVKVSKKCTKRALQKEKFQQEETKTSLMSHRLSQKSSSTVKQDSIQMTKSVSPVNQLSELSNSKNKIVDRESFHSMFRQEIRQI